MGIITDFKQNDKWIGLGKMEIQVVTRSPVPPAGEAEMRQHPGVWGRRPQRESRGQRPLVPAAQARNKKESLSGGPSGSSEGSALWCPPHRRGTKRNHFLTACIYMSGNVKNRSVPFRSSG